MPKALVLSNKNENIHVLTTSEDPIWLCATMLSTGLCKILQTLPMLFDITPYSLHFQSKTESLLLVLQNLIGSYAVRSS